MVLATIVDKSNQKFPRTPDQPRPKGPGARQSPEETVSEDASSRRVNYPSMSTTESPTPLTVESIVLPAPHKTNLLLLPN